MKRATFFLALCAATLASAPLMAQNTQLKMGAPIEMQIEVAPGVQLNMDGVLPGQQLQFLEMTPMVVPFDQAKPQIEAGVTNFMTKANSAQGQAVIDSVKEKYTAIQALEGEFKALPIKDAAAKDTYANKLFDQFMALKEALEAASEFDAEASKDLSAAVSSIGPKGIDANRPALLKLVEPMQTVAKARKATLGESAELIQFVYSDSTGLYFELVGKGEPESEATSKKTLKLYFGNMVEGWTK